MRSPREQVYINKRKALKTGPWGLPTFTSKGEADKEPTMETKKEARGVKGINRVLISWNQVKQGV